MRLPVFAATIRRRAAGEETYYGGIKKNGRPEAEGAVNGVNAAGTHALVLPAYNRGGGVQGVMG